MNEVDIEFDNLFRKIAFQDDEQAFKKLFLEFYPALCVFAIRYTKQEEAARDVVQDVFFSIWKDRKKIFITTSFRNFLITSVRNKCIDCIRKNEVASSYKKQIMLSDFQVSPDKVYTLKELEANFNKALTKLSPKEREAFKMSRFEGMTYIAIAEKMKVSPKTIEVYISKSLKFLRIELREFLL